MIAPRILLVMQRHWPRALILAALNEAGYQAEGAANLEDSLALPGQLPRQRSVRLIILDHEVAGDQLRLQQLCSRHPHSQVLLLQSAVHPSGENVQHVLRYPVSIDEIVQTVRRLVPLPIGPDAAQRLV